MGKWLSALLATARAENWCLDTFCTTCGADRFRSEFIRAAFSHAGRPEPTLKGWSKRSFKWEAEPAVVGEVVRELRGGALARYNGQLAFDPYNGVVLTLSWLWGGSLLSDGSHLEKGDTSGSQFTAFQKQLFVDLSGSDAGGLLELMVEHNHPGAVEDLH